MKILAFNASYVYIADMKFELSSPPDYTIRFATLEGEFKQPALLGVEIQPPLDNLAAEGIAKALSANSEGPGFDASKGGGPIAGEVHVTRNDEKGTALAVYRSIVNGRVIVDHIAKLINPVGSLNVRVEMNDQRGN